MPSTYIGTWQDDLARLATVSSSNEDTDHLAANTAENDDPMVTYRSTAATDTITYTLGAPGTVVAVAIINHNLVGRTVTLASGAGTISAVPIPARVGGYVTNSFLDLSGLSNRTSSTFTLTIGTGSGLPEIGRVLLLSALTEVHWQYGVKPGQRIPSVRIQTFGERDLLYPKGVRRRLISGTVHGEPEEADTYITLHTQLSGEYRPFLYVHDSDVNDPWWVRHDGPVQDYTIDDYGYIQVPLAFTELSNGLPPL